MFVRSGGVWSQQGPKLVGTDAVGAAQQGSSVAISADGNTVLVGGVEDNSAIGATWVFVRSGGLWSQQGPKLVGTGSVGAAHQGGPLAISGDGNTVLVGGATDDSNAGATWAFARSGGVWSQQGGKIVGAGAYMAITGDGNTAIFGNGPVYTRSGGVWTRHGSGPAGGPLAISADGNTAVVYGAGVQAYARNGDAWSRQGGNLLGWDTIGDSGQGSSVAISGDGN
ncbi:MAG TPA: hypothetical protein VLW17_12115, partial [Thermoanaerobaculaceae bacterium]|nr:hypothetical protein [Thermoanaerobaculaceae bacterium]